jgi:hypothetical protein
MLLFSCSVQKNNKLNNTQTAPISIESKLTETDGNIINDFIDFELKKDRYKNYKGFEIVVIEEALKKMKPISVYEFNLKYKESWGKFIDHWILDSLQVKKIKLELDKEVIYHWKVSDFKNIKVSLLKYEELRTIINTSAYINLPRRLIIYLSRPLIIDEKNAFISFEVGNGQLGFGSITHFTVLMRKVNNKWEQNDYYEDGVFN